MEKETLTINFLKKRWINYLFTGVVCFVVVLTLMWISVWQAVEFSDAEISKENNTYESISLPYSANYIGKYTLRVKIKNLHSTKQEFRIFPDDEIHKLKVNGNDISLNHLSHDQKRDYSSGFAIELINLELEKENILEAELTNNSNPTGFKIQAASRLTFSTMIWISVVLLVLVLRLKIHLKIDKVQFGIILVSIFVCLVYLSKTNERTRTFDVFEGGGHRDYIEYLAEHKSFPKPGDGWEYHQPPLYYLIAASASKLAPINSNASGYLWVQMLALFFWVIFLVSSLAVLRLAFVKNPVALYMSSLAMCLWPAGIIHSIRIGNDLGLYAFYGLAFYFIVKWWKGRQSINLFWASVWMAASLICKSNGLAVAAILGCLVFFHILQRRMYLYQPNQRHKILKDVSMVCLFFIAAVTINFYDNIANYINGTSEDWLLSNVSNMINPALRVDNSFYRYIVFDLATFLEKPFISTWDDQYGRQYFWNFVLRSSLSSEFFFSGPAMELWGITNGILLLGMMLGVFIYSIQRSATNEFSSYKFYLYRNAPWVLAVIFPFILLLAYRIKVPLSCNTDFRYIYPVLVAILFFVFQLWRVKHQFYLSKILTASACLIGLNSLIWVALL